MTNEETNLVLEYLKQFQQAVAAGFAALDARFDKIDTRLGGHDSRFDTLEARVMTIARHFDKRLDHLRTELVAHMETLHHEVTGRLQDLEGPKRGNSGGSAQTN